MPAAGWTHIPQLHDRTWLQAQADTGATCKDIAAAIGCAPQSVSAALERNGIIRKRVCSVCGQTFSVDYYRIHIRTCKRHAARRPCQHCGTVYSPGVVPQHERRCWRNPVVFAATRAALDDGDGGCVHSSVYGERRTGAAISLPMLKDLFGSWPKVAQAFGLLWGNALLERDALRDMEHARQIAQDELRIAEAEFGRGLAVCRVRILPTGEVAYMLR